jgi:hypothetical protein
MTAIALFLALVAVCVLGAFYGADSRHTDLDRRHRPNL